MTHASRGSVRIISRTWIGHLDGAMGISRLLLPWALLRVVVRIRLAALQARVQVSRLEDGLPEWKAVGPVPSRRPRLP